MMKLLRTPMKRFFFSALGLALVGALAATPAHAVAVDFGGVICALGDQTSGWPAFIAWISYIAGAAFIYKMLFSAKMYTDDASRHPFHKIPLYGFVGAACLSLPSFVKMLIQTVHSSLPAGGGGAVCTPIAAVAAVGLDKLVTNFVNNIKQPFFMLATFVCFSLGAWFIFKGLNKLSKYNTDPRAYSTQAIIGNFFIGAMLMWMARAKDMIMASVFGGTAGTCNGLAKAGTVDACNATAGLIDWAALGVTGATAGFDQAFIGAMAFFQIIGFIAFIRGWLVAKAVMEGGGNATMGQSVTFIIGGAICMNLVLFLRLAQATMGINFLT